MNKTSKHGRSGPTNGHYNVSMLKDFFEHLEWHCRINHAEQTHLRDRVNPELASTLSHYIKRRGAILIMSTEITFPPGTEEQNKRICEAHHEIERQRMVEALAALRTLRPIFDEALDCIESMKAGEMPVRVIEIPDVGKFLESVGDGNNES